MRSASVKARGQIVDQHRVHRGPGGSHRVGVADTLGAVGVAQAHRDQVETLYNAVGAVGERHRQRDAVVIGQELADAHQAAMPKIWSGLPIVPCASLTARAGPAGAR